MAEAVSLIADNAVAVAAEEPAEPAGTTGENETQRTES